MQALISPEEAVYDRSGNLLGSRVAEVKQEAFPVANPLFWVPCAADVVADQFYWVNGEVLPLPLSPSPTPYEPVMPPAGGGPAVL